MADKKIQIKDWNGSAYDILWPETTLDSIKGLGTFTGTKIPVSTDGGTLTMTDSGTVVGITGAASTIKDDNLTINRALISNASGKVAVSTVTTTQLDRLATATNLNTVSTLVLRDGSGNFSAGTITAALNGNASTATKWANARTITLGGDLAGNVSLDGSGDVSLTATIAANAVTLGTDTTGNYVATVSGGSGISVSGSGSETAAVTISNTGILAISATANQTTVSTASGTATIGLASGIDAAKIGSGLVSSTEFGYLNGVTSSIQTQLNGKANLSGASFTGNVTTTGFFYSENAHETAAISVSGISPKPLAVQFDGKFAYNASSIRFKTEVTNFSFDKDTLLKLEPKKYKMKIEKELYGDKAIDNIGFIAEQAEELGLKFLYQVDKQGIPDYFAYDKLPIYLFAIIKEQESRIKALEAKIQ